MTNPLPSPPSHLTTLATDMRELEPYNSFIYGSYYVYPDGSIHPTEDITIDELILDGHSDDYITTPLPHDNSGYPFIPGRYL